MLSVLDVYTFLQSFYVFFFKFRFCVVRMKGITCGELKF